MKISTMVKVSVLSALAAVIMFIEFPIPFFPPYLQIDLGDLPALIGAFVFGPIAGMLIELIKNLVHILIKGGATGGVGELANFIVGTALVVPAGIIYRKNKSKLNAIIALLVGIIVMVIFAALANYFILLPLYLPGGRPYMPLILSVLVPFNLIKGTIVSLIAIFIYKYASPILHK